MAGDAIDAQCSPSDRQALLEICLDHGGDFDSESSAFGLTDCGFGGQGNQGGGQVSGTCAIQGSGNCRIACDLPEGGTGMADADGPVSSDNASNADETSATSSATTEPANDTSGTTSAESSATGDPSPDVEPFWLCDKLSGNTAMTGYLMGTNVPFLDLTDLLGAWKDDGCVPFTPEEVASLSALMSPELEVLEEVWWADHLVLAYDATNTVIPEGEFVFGQLDLVSDALVNSNFVVFVDVFNSEIQ